MLKASPRDGNGSGRGRVLDARNPNPKVLFLPEPEPARKIPGSGITRTRPVGILITEPDPLARKKNLMGSRIWREKVGGVDLRKWNGGWWRWMEREIY